MSSMQILIVENNETYRLLLKDKIAETGKKTVIFEASNGQQAIAETQSRAYDLIFLAYMLPDMSSADFLKEISNAQDGLGPCPIIFLIEKNQHEEMQDAIKCGVQEYIIKDTTTLDLLNATILKANQSYDLHLKHHEVTQQLVHSERMAAMKRLTGSIVHDFNNFLTIILGNVRLSEMALDKNDAPDVESLKARIESIRGGTERGANLIKQLMVFAGSQYLEPQTVNINDLIKDTPELSSRADGRAHEVELSLMDDLWLVNIDHAQMQRTLIDIIANAREAMVDGGVVSLRTQNVSFTSADKPPSLSDLNGAEFIMVEIIDTGAGIDDELQLKIFEPFFTTKTTKGAGLGLSMADGFVSTSGGKIIVKSENGKGSALRIYLPRSQ